MINPAFHKFLLDENKAMRDLLRNLYAERQSLLSELLDLRGSLSVLEQQEARSRRVFPRTDYQELINNTH